MAPGLHRHAVHRRLAPRGLALALLLCVFAADAPAPRAMVLSDQELFVIANTQFTALHELGHALITELQLPFPGSEEDASDQLAVALMSGGAAPDPRAADKLVAAAQGWLIEWALHRDGGDEPDYWDSHPLDIQRYYNIVCLLHGGVPAAQPVLRRQLQLPYTRAWRCDTEYERAVRGLKWIGANYGAAGGALRRAPARVRVVYEPPDTPDRARMHNLIRGSRVLEQTAAIIEAHLALPGDIAIVLANICGTTAYWRRDLQEIIVCYALVERFDRLAQFRDCLVTTDAKAAPPTEQSIGRCVGQQVARRGRP